MSHDHDQTPDPEAEQALERLLAHARATLKDIVPPKLEELQAYAEGGLPEDRRKQLSTFLALSPDYQVWLDSYLHPVEPALLAQWQVRLAELQAEEAKGPLARLWDWCQPLLFPVWRPALAFALGAAVLIPLLRHPNATIQEDRLLEGPGAVRSTSVIRAGEPFLAFPGLEETCATARYFLWTRSASDVPAQLTRLECRKQLHVSGPEVRRVIHLEATPLTSDAQVLEALAPLLNGPALDEAASAPDAARQLAEALERAGISARQVGVTRAYRVEE